MQILSSEPVLLPLFKKAAQFLLRHFSGKFFTVIVAYLVLTNAVFWLLDYTINAYRYWLVIDYLWLLPLLFLKNKYTTILFCILFSFIYFIDVLYWIRQFFPFIDLNGLLTFLTYLPFSPKIYWWFIAFGFINWLGLVILSLKLQRHMQLKMLPPFFMLYAVFQFCFFDYRGVNYSDHLKTQGYWGSMYETYQALKFNQTLNWRSAKQPNFTPAQFPSVLMQQLDFTQPPEKVVFILNESWGVLDYQAQFNAKITQKISQLPQVKLIQQGESKVDDGTIIAEIREMCGLTSDSPNFKLVPSEKFNDCVPRKLRRLDYHTQSFHGAEAGMYARDEWYTNLGFSQPKFYANLNSLERCASFPGACDKNILLEIAHYQSQLHGKSFIYWLTLNSHHPYSKKDIESYAIDCNTALFDGRQEACRNLNLQHQLFSHLANSIKQGYFKDTTFIIVGDHMPPLVSDVKKDSFKNNTVPFLIFKVTE
jgi:hypothetical protein